MQDTLAVLTGLVAVLLGGLVVLIPVTGLTARLAAKPIAQLLLRAREEGAGRRLGLVERRLDALEQQLDRLEVAYDRLAEAQAFDRRLAAPRVAPSGLSVAPGGADAASTHG